MSGHDLVGVHYVSRQADLRLKLIVADDGVVRPLNDTTFEFAIVNGKQKLVVATLANGKITVPNPANGEIFVAIPKADFTSLSDGNYKYYCTATKNGATEMLLEEAYLELR